MQLKYLSLGLRKYSEVWELQKQLQQELIHDSGEDALICCQHHPVITLGRSSKRTNVLASAENLASNGIELYEIERGGDVTLHNPGQLVVYPILNLNRHKKDVDWYMRSLEQVIGDSLSQFGMASMTIKGKTGVWVNSKSPNAQVKYPESLNACDASAKKIASIGVRISRWCTLHGLAVNVENNLRDFQMINPCGFNSDIMTSIAQERLRSTSCTTGLDNNRPVTIEEFEHVLVGNFCRIFSYTVS